MTLEEALSQRVITQDQFTAIRGFAQTMGIALNTFQYVGDIGSPDTGTDQWFQTEDGRVNAHFTQNRSSFVFGDNEHFMIDHTALHHRSTYHRNRRLVDSGNPEPDDQHWVFDHRSHLPCGREEEDNILTAPHLHGRNDTPTQRHINLHRATDPGNRAPGPCIVM